MDLSRRRALNAVTGLAVTALAAPRIARAAVRTLRLGHNNVDQSHYGQGALAFAKAVAADPGLAGQYKVGVYRRAELGDEASMLKDCMAGTLDLAIISASLSASAVPELGLINAPFVFADAAHARRALDGAFGANLARLANGKGLMILAWGENGVRQITANKPVRTPQDLRGLKLRVPPSDIMLNGMRALGADAAPLGFGQLKEALRTGQFDGQENAIVTIDSGKLFEVQKYISMSRHMYDAVAFIVSPDVIEDLSEPQRAALARCAQLGAATTRTVAETADREGLAHLKAAGMTVIEDVDVAAFRAAAQPFGNTLAARFGPTLISQLHEAAA